MCVCECVYMFVKVYTPVIKANLTDLLTNLRKKATLLRSCIYKDCYTIFGERFDLVCIMITCNKTCGMNITCLSLA